jgi:hypothetical protein
MSQLPPLWVLAVTLKFWTFPPPAVMVMGIVAGLAWSDPGVAVKFNT